METFLVQVVLWLGVLISAGSAVGIAQPNILKSIAKPIVASTLGFYFIILIRALLGVALILASNHVTRLDEFVLIFGILALIAAVAVALMGKARLGKLIDWFMARSNNFMRAWCVLGIALGIVLIFAAL
jgi:hypothetical protein